MFGRKVRTRTRGGQKGVLFSYLLPLVWLLGEFWTNCHEKIKLELFKERIVDAVGKNQPDQYVIDAGNPAIIRRSLTFGFIG